MDSHDHADNGLIGFGLYIGFETADGHYGWAKVDATSGGMTLDSFAVNEFAGQDLLTGSTANAAP